MTHIPRSALLIPNLSSNNPRESPSQKPSLERPYFDLIPITYTDLFPALVQSGLVIPIPAKPLKTPYPRWYDENVYCKFHLGVQGHSKKNSEALKYQVQALMEKGYLSFEKGSE